MMGDVLDAVGGVLAIMGAGLLLLAGVGVLRFPDVYSRMHAASKAPALGVVLIGIATALIIRSTAAGVTAGLVIVLQLVAGPVGTHVLGRSVYHRLRPQLDGPDELADAEADRLADPAGSEAD